MIDHSTDQHPWPGWTQAQQDLAQQMTRATYDAILKDAVAYERAGGFTILAPTETAREWLANRLHETIRRTLAGLTGRAELEIEFGVIRRRVAPDGAERPAGLRLVDAGQSEEPETSNWSALPLEALQFDSFEQGGYFPMSNYVQRFYPAYMGAPAMQLVNYVRSFYQVPRSIYDKKARGFVLNPDWSPWTPPRRFQASELGRKIKVSRQRITGMKRTCHRYDAAYRQGETWPACQCGLHAGQIEQAKPSPAYPDGRQVCRYWWPGLLEILEQEEGILKADKRGDPDKIASLYYDIQVFQPLPLLTPWQVRRLPDEVQREHREYLLNPRNRLSLERWSAITVERLMPYLVQYLWSGIQQAEGGRAA